MKKGPSAFIYLFIVFISAIISIFICVKLSRFFSLDEKISDLLLVVLYFIIYGSLLSLWIDIDKHWRRD